MQWVKVGKTDLNYVELKEGLNKNDIVYVLPSEGLIKSQQRFSERLRNRFSNACPRVYRYCSRCN